MTPRPASGSLRRYAPYVIAGAVLATFAVLSYRSYAGRSRSSRRLKRSNATRRRNSASRRHPRTAATHSDHEPEGILTDEQLLQTLNQELNVTLPLGIHIPESTAEALTETGHAAQQARGARNGLGGREGRAGRRGSVLDTELSFEEETKENSENQNLLTLLYTIAQVSPQPAAPRAILTEIQGPSSTRVICAPRRNVQQLPSHPNPRHPLSLCQLSRLRPVRSVRSSRCGPPQDPPLLQDPHPRSFHRKSPTSPGTLLPRKAADDGDVARRGCDPTVERLHKMHAC